MKMRLVGGAGGGESSWSARCGGRRCLVACLALLLPALGLSTWEMGSASAAETRRESGFREGSRGGGDSAESRFQRERNAGEGRDGFPDSPAARLQRGREGDGPRTGGDRLAALHERIRSFLSRFRPQTPRENMMFQVIVEIEREIGQLRRESAAGAEAARRGDSPEGAPRRDSLRDDFDSPRFQSPNAGGRRDAEPEGDRKPNAPREGDSNQRSGSREPGA